MKKPWKCKCGEWNWARNASCEKCNRPKETQLVNNAFYHIITKLKEIG